MESSGGRRDTPCAISQENVDTYHRTIDAFNRRDLDVVLEVLDPDFELHASLYTMLGGEAAVFRGQEEVRSFFRDLGENFSEFHVEITEIDDLGEQLVAVGLINGIGRASGAEFEQPIGYVIDFKDGKIVRIDDYLNPADALEAAGLSE
jgi:ketosteroid isomerase-like protein